VLDRGVEEPVDDDKVVDWFLDPAIEHEDGASTNSEPLFINTVGSLADRPVADTAIPNLTVAADDVRTNADLAKKESANEAARRAVNGVLAATGASRRASSCTTAPNPRTTESVR
jgi:uncharacterized protein with NAD-binding domain and iron-sulfur cluster